MNRIPIPALLALTVALAGCSKDSTTALAPAGGSQASGYEQQTIQQNVAETPGVYEDLAYELPGDESIPYASTGSEVSPQTDPAPAGLRPPFWFRVLKERQRSFDIQIDELEDHWEARVEVRDKLAGILNIYFPSSDPMDSDLRSGELVQKRFADLALRRAFYVKRKVETSDGSEAEQIESDAMAAHRGGWHLAAISNRRASSPEHTAAVLKIWLQTESGAKYEIDDPLALMRFPRELPGVLPGEGVRIVAKVADPDDLAFLFTRWGRQVMLPVDGVPEMDIPSEPGLFAGHFRAPDYSPLFHIGVNALDRPTLMTRDGAYDSDFWGLLLRNKQPEVAVAN